MDSSNNFINVAYIYEKIYQIFNGDYLPDWDTILGIISAMISFIRPVSILLSFLFLAGIIYSSIRTKVIMHEAEEKAHGHAAHGHESSHGEAPQVHSTAETTHGAVVNKRWEKILQHIGSHNSSDWRLAILECDIILEEMLTKMGYHGETVAEKLKAVEKSDFLSIDKAWEAHRVRNTIAHQGSNFQITDREARRVVGLYQDVFKEFHFI
ncbi:MAG: hypothetical protein EXS46_03585 [Candidatus Taylorbacteria bacterium]|nr:hypothetical protein [Candidatus Taylorbacteria bacterium]